MIPVQHRSHFLCRGRGRFHAYPYVSMIYEASPIPSENDGANADSPYDLNANPKTLLIMKLLTGWNTG